MTAVANSLFNRHQGRIEEVISKNIEVFMPALDPVWEDTIQTSIGVGGANEIGRDMHITKVYMGSMAGVIEEGAANYGDIGLYGDLTTAFGAKMHQQQINQTWPNPLDGANATPYRLVIPMRSQMTNLMMTIGELTAEATPAFIGEVIVPKLEGFARNIAHTLCNYWYVSQNSNYRLCLVSNVAGGGATKSVTFKPDNLAIDRFGVGMRVDVMAMTAGVVQKRANDTTATLDDQDKTTRIKLYVTKVDELTGTVELTAETNVNAWSGQTSVANGDAIVMANSGIGDGAGGLPTFKGIAGVNSWMKTGDSSGSTNTNTNTLLGAEATVGALGGSDGKINVNDHPEFKSFFHAMTGPLTEHKMRQLLHGFHRAKNKHGQYIDCLIASDGVWLAYEATKIGREWIDRTGRQSSISNEGSSGGFKITVDGKDYTGYTSQFVESQAMYGIRKGGNNWKRYVPPDPRGVQSFDRAPSSAFKFVAGIVSGTGSNRLPIFASSSGEVGSVNLMTEGSQMPGMLRMQIAPDQPAGLKVTGMTEDRLYADS